VGTPAKEKMSTHCCPEFATSQTTDSNFLLFQDTTDSGDLKRHTAEALHKAFKVTTLKTEESGCFG